MTKFWNKYAPYWHICMAILGAIVALVFWFKDVSAYGPRIEMVETTQSIQDKKITRMDYNIQLIGRAVGVRPLEKSDDE